MEVPVNATHQHHEGEFVQLFCEAMHHLSREKLVVCAHYKPGFSSIEVQPLEHFEGDCEDGSPRYRKLKKLKVEQYIPSFVDTDERCVNCVEAFQEVEELDWIKRWKKHPGFVEFRLGVRDGERGTLMAIEQVEPTDISGRDHTHYVVGFLSGDFTKLEMLRYWKEWKSDDKGRLID